MSGAALPDGRRDWLRRSSVLVGTPSCTSWPLTLIRLLSPCGAAKRVWIANTMAGGVDQDWVAR